MGEATTKVKAAARGEVEVRRDADGEIWLIVPNAMVNLTSGASFGGRVVQGAFRRWANGVLAGAAAEVPSANPHLELGRLRQWVADLQSGMYVNCVYCGHRYGPDDVTPATLVEAPGGPMAEALRAHIEQCPEHPMSALRAENASLREHVARLTAAMVEAVVDCETVPVSE